MPGPDGQGMFFGCVVVDEDKGALTRLSYGGAEAAARVVAALGQAAKLTACYSTPDEYYACHTDALAPADVDLMLGYVTAAQMLLAVMDRVPDVRLMALADVPAEGRAELIGREAAAALSANLPRLRASSAVQLDSLRDTVLYERALFLQVELDQRREGRLFTIGDGL